MRSSITLILTGLALILLLAAACSDDPESPDGPEGLVGAWQWVETCFPYPSECLTPETEEYDRFLIFGADSVYEEWQDDVREAECGYSVIRGDIGDGITRTLLTYDCADDPLVFVFEDPMTLTLSLGMPGSAVERFTRLPTGVM